MRDFTLGIFLLVADVSENRKPNMNLFVLSLWMKHVHNEVDNIWWRTQLETCGGVLSYRGLHETGAIQFSQMLLKQVTSNVSQKLSDGHNTKKKVV